MNDFCDLAKPFVKSGFHGQVFCFALPFLLVAKMSGLDGGAGRWEGWRREIS